MSTLIIYVTRHGCTEKAAGILENKLEDEVTLVNLKRTKPDLSAFDTVILGGSIHAGQIQGKLRKFYQKNLDTLLQKRLGLYLCCMEEGERAQMQFDEGYPRELRDHAAVTGLFGGEFDFQRMNFLERGIVKKVAKVTESVSKLKVDVILEFAASLNALK